MMTLSDFNPSNTPMVHITAEFAGRRYYLGTDMTFPGAEAIALQYKNKYPKASIFLSNKGDNTSINGAWPELEDDYEFDCQMTPDGTCQLIGSEECDQCPHHFDVGCV